MDRSKMISQLEDPSEVFDFLVIGGGATGIGIALDASTRGYRVALFEQSDFTKGTSSRSTKLVHGGVRYLAQGDTPWFWKPCGNEACYARTLPIW